MTGDAWAGWTRLADDEPDAFASVFGPSFARADGPGRASVAVETRALHRNRLQGLHGGFIATVADHVGFAALIVLGRPEQIDATTIDLHVQYLAPGRIGPPLVGEVELLKETGRMFFLRMTFRQEDVAVAAATAMLRKARSRT